MIPERVIMAVTEQMRPLILELARYGIAGNSIKMNFEVGSVLIEFNKVVREDENNS